MADDPKNAMTPAEIERFLREPNVGVLSWTTSKGDVASSPVWYEYRDGKFWFVSPNVYAKVKAISKRPRVSFCVQDAAPPYRYVSVRAEATVHADPTAAREVEVRLAQHYLGRTAGRYYVDTTAQEYPGEPRLVELTPLHTSSYNGGAGINPATLLAMKAIRAVGL